MNLWNMNTPTKRIDFYFKIDVLFILYPVTQEAFITSKICEKYF